eukprot:7258870-Pyramimonas_sp.AAC.2
MRDNHGGLNEEFRPLPESFSFVYSYTLPELVNRYNGTAYPRLRESGRSDDIACQRTGGQCQVRIGEIASTTSVIWANGASSRSPP